jgi:Fe-S cluster assembly iron-binding protein IscA
MLIVTDKAGVRLPEIVSVHLANSAMQIVCNDARLKMRLASPRPSDTTFDHNGRIVLVRAEKVSAHFEGRTLDLRDTDHEPQLHIRPHNRLK